ncbi:MAG TPA: DUF359 domain-containing protein [Methanothermococcus okinawensis]|uniref:GTP-dependent dephospho-CoA kinase n=1 Tax=Methanofervidicoccus abyssi TaxID=2082189 RepID=A0A401HPN6_9EURY|nr:DUF359 domain-containing protein [Methanofervidicoccus abyssi]GBF36226.1 conserved hypothetical protein [Methanofervidicoccus abyssi]HIP15835.1 DUF359 domain-containing protein [Methanothermococcus okinawensis]HIP34996.1 DUF359 domain-containing protein [Methanothermococcus okinawensis]
MYIITQELREVLKKPFGKIYKELPYINGKVISIGDITTKNLLSKNIIPHLSIFDLKTRRNIPVSIEHRFSRVFQVKNPPGCISDEALGIIRHLSKVEEGNTAIKVEGEEDLLALPVIKYFPYGTYVLYGQPNMGVVVLRVDEDLKKRVNKIFSLMIKK